MGFYDNEVPPSRVRLDKDRILVNHDCSDHLGAIKNMSVNTNSTARISIGHFSLDRGISPDREKLFA